MGLLDGMKHRDYYQGNDHGNYQFTSLDDIITQFQIAYVGEDKIISKIRRADIAFHAQRALQELSFDTFKSTKAQEIVLPPSLSMILPHDYVNYTEISTVDSSGIKHPLFPTSATSNPFNIKQESSGEYDFIPGEQLIKNPDFSLLLEEGWDLSRGSTSKAGAWQGSELINGVFSIKYKKDFVGIRNGSLRFESYWKDSHGVLGWGKSYGVWQEVDVAHADLLDLSAVGLSAEIITDNVGTACRAGIVRVGVSSVSPHIRASEDGVATIGPYGSTPKHIANVYGSKNKQHGIHDNPDHLDLGYVEWNDGAGVSSRKELSDIPVDKFDSVWVWVQSYAPWQKHAISNAANTVHVDYDPLLQPSSGPYTKFKNGQGWNVAPGYTTAPSPNVSTFISPSINIIDDIEMVTSSAPNMLRGTADGRSTAQANYSESTTISDNSDAYWPLDGSRYGLDPQSAQANGSFYMDTRLGKVNFSSNIAGKTVILDYISDSLGTDDEMQVHKFAEEAMYKWIAHAILATRANTPEYVVQRFKKERFAAVRTAKLRLSNIKLEELTQILRGKSKQIKH